MLPQFTLLTFTALSAYIDAERPAFVAPGQENIGKYHWVIELLNKKRDCWARVDAGTFVFKTKEGYGLLHALQHMLSTQGINFTAVHFEQDLYGNVPPELVEPLEHLGVVVHQIKV